MNLYHEVLPKSITIGDYVATVTRAGRLYQYTVRHQRTAALVAQDSRKHLHEAIKAAKDAAQSAK